MEPPRNLARLLSICLDRAECHPLVSMGAIALFTRSLIISYTALYCLAGMVITLLGLMKICGLSFGAVSALALALVLGMSVDYIIHIAHAFKNTLLPQRFHKSRATVLARATSIGSAAATTLASVSPLLFAQLLPSESLDRFSFSSHASPFASLWPSSRA